jgi:hypothetical protein
VLAFIATPFGMYTKPSRRMGAAAVLAVVDSAGTIASNRGNATVAPMPRKKVRRRSTVLVMITEGSSLGFPER